MRKNAAVWYKMMDWQTAAITVCLCLFGLLAIANATCDPYPPGGETGLLAIVARINPYYPRWQAIWLATGLGLATAAIALDYKHLRTFAYWIYGFGLILLVVVLFMPAGRGGVHNSIYFGSPDDPATQSFQPGELVKLAYIAMMARLLSSREKPVEKPLELLPFLAVTAVPVALVIRQGEVGTALTYMCIFAVMMFLSGSGWKLLTGLALSGAASLAPIWFLLTGFQKDRVLNFFDPTRDLSNTGLNVYYAKTAAASGRIWGKGLFVEGALSQLDYVPEKHTDFIFSVTAEAVGLVGSVLIVLAFIALLWRALRIARTAKDSFGSLLCVGVAAMVFFHVFENISMNIGLMPVTGIPLPFLSYGGSAMWAYLIGVGIVLNVSIRRKNKEPGRQ